MSGLGGKDLGKLGIPIQKAGVTVGVAGVLNFDNSTVTASGAVITVTPSGSPGGASWTELEVNFGNTPVYDANFTITDAAISAVSKIIVVPSGKTATGRTSGDWQWDGATFAALADVGFATCYVTFTPGPIVGRRNIQYQVS